MGDLAPPPALLAAGTAAAPYRFSMLLLILASFLATATSSARHCASVTASSSASERWRRRDPGYALSSPAARSLPSAEGPVLPSHGEDRTGGQVGGDETDEAGRRRRRRAVLFRALAAGTGRRSFSSSSSSLLAAQSRDDTVSSPPPALNSVLSTVPRGGALYPTDDDDDDDEGGVIVKKMRNLIRSLLDVAERKSPSLASAFRSLVGALEGVTGMRLLPRVEKQEGRKKSGRRKKKGGGEEEEAEVSSGKRQTKRRKRAEAEDEEEESESEDEAEIKRRKKKAAKAGAAGSAAKAGTGTKKKKKAPAGGGQALAHASKSLKSSNPNYRIQRELKEFLANPPPNLKVSVGKNIRVWIVHMTGTEGSIYAGEKYRLRVSFPPDYPAGPPSVYFLQPAPKHEHVYTNGDICLSLLGRDWRPTLTVQSLANSILSILSGAMRKDLPMDNARHCTNKPGGRQDNWIYHDDNC